MDSEPETASLRTLQLEFLKNSRCNVLKEAVSGSESIESLPLKIAKEQDMTVKISKDVDNENERVAEISGSTTGTNSKACASSKGPGKTRVSFTSQVGKIPQNATEASLKRDFCSSRLEIAARGKNLRNIGKRIKRMEIEEEKKIPIEKVQSSSQNGSHAAVSESPSLATTSNFTFSLAPNSSDESRA